MECLKDTIETLRSRLCRYTDEPISYDMFNDALFLIEKQNEYIKKLEALINTNN